MGSLLVLYHVQQHNAHFANDEEWSKVFTCQIIRTGIGVVDAKVANVFRTKKMLCTQQNIH